MSIYMAMDDNTGTVKIGFSKNVDDRINQLQTGCSGNLRVLRVLDGDQSTERWLHKRFNLYRVRGEWFRFHDDMLSINPPDVFKKQTIKQESKWANQSAMLVNARKLGLLSDDETILLIKEYRRAIVLLEGTLPPTKKDGGK